MADDLARAPLAHTDVVQTSNGPVRGYLEDGLEIFKGLRYGAAPAGLRRFKPPQRPAAWTEAADAVAYGAPAIQSGLAPGERLLYAGSTLRRWARAFAGSDRTGLVRDLVRGLWAGVRAGPRPNEVVLADVTGTGSGRP